MKKYAVALLSALAVALLTGHVSAQGQWGTLQGQIVWGGAQIPERKPLNIDKDQANCLRNGKILEETFVVNAKNKGVKSVMVWLAVDKDGKVDPKGKLDIHPALKNVSPAKVSLDQPCCMFIPQVQAIREGQILEAKNSDKVPHNVNIVGGALNPNLNFLLPPGTSKEVKDWKASPIPVPLSCSIHPWMKSYIRVFNHPYYAVTDEDGKFEIKNAPAGAFRMVVWHPEAGFVVGERDKNGIAMNVAAGKTTDLGQIKLTPAK